ncbi:aspartyl/asparaginyl beta-hydroxylase domain-containing protein [Pseudomonas lopnurensis]|uniref:aspartyl/asparaginyl beta-hydroxylase domain-containing protein n=1 Tax=Pseudomonas lopnurensis TaxID=1477517 RepID=UPI0028A61623|nr:aspartyl/asparaginyl beta-hydroxylase domain-containing protein [Pseudomonas lopnurensis]
MMRPFPPLPAYARLPPRFPVSDLQAAVRALPDPAWTPHFNSGYHNGGWSGIALLGPESPHDPLLPAHGGISPAVRASQWCSPFWQALLERIPMRISSARLLRLEEGGCIREHCDPDLGDPQGDVRLHIPIHSHPAVEFMLEGLVVPMAEGECWLLDLARPHRVENHGDRPRIHLVIDARRNDWLYRQIACGLVDTPTAQPARSTLAFAAFRRQVHERPALAEALCRLTDAGQFAARAVEFGDWLGLRFSVDDVRAAMRQGRNDWSGQWRA